MSKDRKAVYTRRQQDKYFWYRLNGRVLTSIQSFHAAQKNHNPQSLYSTYLKTLGVKSVALKDIEAYKKRSLVPKLGS